MGVAAICAGAIALYLLSPISPTSQVRPEATVGKSVAEPSVRRLVRSSLSVAIGNNALAFGKVNEACDITLPTSVTRIEGGDVSPGQTICLEPGRRAGLDLRNVAGTRREPIVIRTVGGPVVLSSDLSRYATLDIRTSRYVVVSGLDDTARCGATASADNQHCGIIVEGGNLGVVANQGSHDIRLEGIEVRDTERAGFALRSYARNGFYRGEWIVQNLMMVDNYIHDVGTEGAYIGSSSYDEGDDPTLEGVHVSRNLVIRSGWDGIQVGSAENRCEISSNIVIQAAIDYGDDQRTGIINNRGSTCDIVGNIVLESAGEGIYVQGNGGNTIANNVVVRPGVLVADDSDGIRVVEGSQLGEPLRIVHNTIVDSDSNAIKISGEGNVGSLVANNLLVIGGGDQIDAGELRIITKGNKKLLGIPSDLFVDRGVHNFEIVQTTDLIEPGARLDPPVEVDLSGRSRSITTPTPGAYELSRFR
jgi:parallel beta-helix repeat protein